MMLELTLTFKGQLYFIYCSVECVHLLRTSTVYTAHTLLAMTSDGMSLDLSDYQIENNRSHMRPALRRAAQGTVTIQARMILRKSFHSTLAFDLV